MSLRPFWRYYGGKWRVAPRYPAPEFGTIVEPFAGAAGYATRYHDRDVVLVDANPTIAAIWRFLIDATPDDIQAIGDIPDGGTVDDIDAPQAARWLAGFWCNAGTVAPCKTPSAWVRNAQADGVHRFGWGPEARERIAAQVARIKHWTIIEGEYADAPDVEATWFVDPPYSTPAGRFYPSKVSDYDALGAWCQSRPGQVIVCEQEGADWLPFRPFGEVRPAPGKHRPDRNVEVIWTSGGLSLFGGTP